MFKGRQTIQAMPEFLTCPIKATGAWSPDTAIIPPDQINPPKDRRRLRAVRSRAFLDIAQPRRDRREESNVSPSTRHSNFIDLMINDNRDLWDRLMNNPFCARMGNGTARLEGFEDYAIGEFIFLRNYVRYKLGLYSKTDDWVVLSTEAPVSLADSIDFANLQLEVCIQELNIPEVKVLRAEPKPKVKAYIDWVNTSTKTEDWFGLHVLMAPCILGYFDIATKLFNDPTTKRDTTYFNLWIEPNARDPFIAGSAQSFRAWFDNYLGNQLPNASDPRYRHWRYLFRKACEMEIAFFDTGL